MRYTNADKQALKDNTARIYSRITVLNTPYVFTEDDYISTWTYEDFRYVPDTGFIGQFVERLLDGTLMDLPKECNLDGKRIKLELGIKKRNDIKVNYYDYGNFIITETEYSDTEGKTTFKSADYTKLFNDTYINMIAYPCTSMQLLDQVAKQCGIEMDSDGVAYTCCGTDDENGSYYNLPAGNYNFLIDGVYYNFSTTTALGQYDTIMLIKNGSNIKIIKKDVRLTTLNKYEITRTELTYTSGTSKTGTTIYSRKSLYKDFINNDYVIFGDYFDSDATYRDVVKAIAQLAYSWARINEENKLCVDFKVKKISDVDTYNILDTDEYYESEAVNKNYGPVNKVSVGVTDVDGESIIATSSSYTTATECSIVINDNPLTYTETLRRIAINGSESLFGLEYYPMEINSIGHPWLEGDDYIQFTNVDGDTVYTYPFDRKIQYSGYIEETLSSSSQSSAEQEHEYKSSDISKIKKTLITVDKMNGKITSLAEGYDGISERVSKTEQDMEKIQNVFDLQGGNNLIRNSAFLLKDEVWTFSNYDPYATGNIYHTPLGSSYTNEYLTSLFSHGKIELRNVKVISDITKNNVLVINPRREHTFSFKYKNDENTYSNILIEDLRSGGWTTLANISMITEKTELTSYSDVTFTPESNKIRITISSSTTDNGKFTIYDMMLNEGSRQDWSPSKNEISQTAIRLNQMGITVLATGSNFATIMSTREFGIYNASYNNGEMSIGDVVTSFDGDGIKTNEIIAETITTGDYVMEEKDWSGTKHHIEYFRG